MGFIIVVAGRAFSDATGMRVRSQNMLNSAEEAGRISALLKEDISQMGAKGWGASSASGTAFDTVASVYLNFNGGSPTAAGTDLSSYELTLNSPSTANSSYDKLSFRKAYFDVNGICGGVMNVEWSVRLADSVLIRQCNAISNPKCNGEFDENECPNNTEVEMARNVAKFRFLPSKPGTPSAVSTDDILFPPSPSTGFKLLATNSNGSNVSPVSENGKVTVGSFAQNSPGEAVKYVNFYLAETGNNDCFQLTFSKDEEYAINFDLLHSVNNYDPCRSGGPGCAINLSARYNKMAMFQPGRDHLSIGLRKTDMSEGPITAAGVPDFLFYPPQNTKADNISRHFEFSVPGDVSACVGITAAFYSIAAGGHLDITNFKVYRKTDNIYHFDENYNPATTPEKASVKAFKLELEINRKGEINRVATVIPVPNNGVTGGN